MARIASTRRGNYYLAEEGMIKARRETERYPDEPNRWLRIFPDNRHPATRGIALGSFDCWCGQPCGHDWPGRDGGEPHPR